MCALVKNSAFVWQRTLLVYDKHSHFACMVKSSMLMSVHGDNVLVYGEEYCVDVCVCV